ncbi:ABC transporter permease subunit [Anaerosporobacter sp.]
MKAIIKRELLNYLKNPVFWIGLVIVMISIYKDLGPYLQIHYFKSTEEIQALDDIEVENIDDADIMDGYLPATKEQQRELVIKEIQKELVQILGYSEADAKQIVENIRQKDMNVTEMTDYLEKYKFNGANYVYEKVKKYKGTKEEVNEYISSKLEDKSYSYYFSRKFADFTGLYLCFFTIILLAFLYVRDTKKDIYELLHTKPISAKSYVIGKVLGGFLFMVLILCSITTFFDVLCVIHGVRAGFPVNAIDLYLAAIKYVLPNLLMIVSVYTIIALLFKNPLPAIPLLYIYMIYSNMGSVGSDGLPNYYGRPLAIFVRFSGDFFATTNYFTFMNQMFLILCSIIFICFSIMIWKKRRVF